MQRGRLCGVLFILLSSCWLLRPLTFLPNSRATTARQVCSQETTYTYTPSDTRAARALCCDDVRAERPPLVRGVHEGLRGALGVHVAHFRRMFLTARNSLRHPTSPIMSRTGPTGFDAWSSWGCFTDGGRRAGHLSVAADPCHSAVLVNLSSGSCMVYGMMQWFAVGRVGTPPARK